MVLYKVVSRSIIWNLNRRRFCWLGHFLNNNLISSAITGDYDGGLIAEKKSRTSFE